MPTIENKTMSPIGYSLAHLDPTARDEKGRLPRTVTGRLVPGMNEVSEEAADYLRNHPVMKVKFEDEELVFHGNVKIERMSARKAQNMVKKTFDLDTLYAWRDKKLPPTVKRLIDFQINAIKDPDMKEEGYQRNVDRLG